MRRMVFQLAGFYFSCIIVVHEPTFFPGYGTSGRPGVVLSTVETTGPQDFGFRV